MLATASLRIGVLVHGVVGSFSAKSLLNELQRLYFKSPHERVVTEGKYLAGGLLALLSAQKGDVLVNCT
jgi:hypothetical protein